MKVSSYTAYRKKWYEDNKNRHKNSVDRWRNNNPGKYEQYREDERTRTTLPYWIVYLLPNADNYVGKTNNPTSRMYHHKSEGRNSNDWVELARFDNEEDALKCEAEYHDKGYNGRNNNYKQYQHTYE